MGSCLRWGSSISSKVTLPWKSCLLQSDMEVERGLFGLLSSTLEVERGPCFDDYPQQAALICGKLKSNKAASQSWMGRWQAESIHCRAAPNPDVFHMPGAQQLDALGNLQGRPRTGVTGLGTGAIGGGSING